jgi:periplasmic copper chaperone A
MKYAACVFLLMVSSAWADVKIENAWARATPPGAKIGAGYMTIHNTGATADRLVGASSPAARKVEPHVTVRDGDISRMRAAPGYDVPANGTFELTPGGSHLMLMDLKAPLKEGDKVPLLLRFQRSGEVKVELEVRALGAMAPMRHLHGH